MPSVETLRSGLESYFQRPDGPDLLAERITREEWDSIVHDWAVNARDDQLAPVFARGGGRWHTWLVLGGRGSGKTRAGAEWIRAQVEGEPPLADRRSHRVALVGDTIAQVRSVMIEGVSGLFAVYPPKERPRLEASKNQLVWDNGSIAQLFAADDPDSLRGPQFDAAWCDELCKWRQPDYAWDTLQFALRLGRWPQCVDRATGVRVKLDSGALASVTGLALLGGANLAAVRNGDGVWEVLQFLSAVLTAPATYTLTGFLRGQAGTEHAMRSVLAAGARFALLDGALAGVDMTEDEVGLAFNWKCGPASRDIGSSHYVDVAHTFVGERLKPLSPVHVRATRSAGDLSLSWVRRTRIGGDSWDGIDVPLGETEERYEIDILDGPTVKRTLTATSPAATYTAAQQTEDFGAPQPSVSLRIFQLSATRGRGTPRDATL